MMHPTNLPERLQFPAGWDKARMREVLEHYEYQAEDEALAEDEAAFDADGMTMPDLAWSNWRRPTDLRSRSTAKRTSSRSPADDAWRCGACKTWAVADTLGRPRSAVKIH